MLKWATLTWSPSLTTKTTTTTTMSNIYVTLTATLIIVATLTTATNGFRSSSETLNADNARKLFGGYRITPKHCRATKTLPDSDPRANGPTICMFNHECAQRNGEVVGACMDGFLFGACCQIPNNHDIESTLINDAQNAYFQQHHQQHKVQQQQAISNPAAAQSYEAYGGDSLQQQSVEYQAVESGNKYNQQQQQHPLDVNEPENIDKVYQQLDSTNSYDKPQDANYQQIYSSSSSSSSSSSTYLPSVGSSSSTYLPSVGSSSSTYAEVTPTISTSASSISYVSEQQQVEQQQQQESFQQHQQEEQMQEATSQQQSEQDSNSNPSSNEGLSQQLASLELGNDANLQSNIEASNSNAIAENPPPPTVHVSKNKVKISSPSSPPHNDDFVMQALSTLAPGHEEDHIAFTTEVPMKISSSLVDQGSSESNSFEEESTQMPMHLPSTPVRDQLAEAPFQQHVHEQEKLHQNQQHQLQQQQIQQQQVQQQQIQQQQIQQQQQQEPESTQETQHLQQITTTMHQEQRPSESHNHNHLLLDEGEFTHSDITHPGADAVLVEDDLQFSTGYGPVPVYVESPGASEGAHQYTTIKAPAAEDKYVLVQTITNDQLNKKPSQTSAVGSPTTSSAITTHVDSIESIILQLNNTNAGPSYNVVSQQTPSYGYDATSTMGVTGNYEQQSEYYDSTSSPTGTTTLRPLSLTDAVNFDENETKRPEGYYASEQNHHVASQETSAYHEPMSDNNSPVSYDTVSDEKVEASNTYLQNEYPTPKPALVSSSTISEQNYGDSEAVLEDHTVPESNYNDVINGAHQTSEFNKMPAVGIAYPVDMSYFEGEEGNIVADSSNQRPTYQSANAQKQPSNVYQKVPAQTEPQPTAVTYTRLPSVTESRPVATYIGMITAQNFNQHQQKPLTSTYNQVPEEVSISSHTTKVQSDVYNAGSSTSPTYHTAAPEKLPTNNYGESSSSSYYISSTSSPVANRLSTIKPIIITAGSARPKPKPKPKPKPNSKRPTKRPTAASSTNGGNKKPAKPQSGGGKKPVVQQPTSNPTQAPQQPSNSYGEEALHAKPVNTYQESQPSVYSQNTEPIYTKQPIAPAENNYLETLVSHDEPQKPTSGNYKPKPAKTKKPAVKPSQPTSSYNNPPEPTSGYQELLPPHSYITESTDTRKPVAQPSKNYQSSKKPVAQPGNNYSKKPAQQPSLVNSYDEAQQPVSVYSQLEQSTKLPIRKPTQPSLSSYESESNLQKITLSTYNQPEQQSNRPSPPLNSYNQPAQNTKLSSQQPSNTYNQEQQLLVTPSKRPTTHRPIIANKKPSSQHKPVSTSYVTGPTSPRPPTTFGYHDDEVPPLLIADDKLDSFVHSTAEAVAAQNAGYPSTHAAPPSVYVSSVTPINVQHPAANTYNHYKKPGFVKVQQPTIRPPVPTVLITPKPTVINLVTSSSWTQQTNGGITAAVDNVYGQTTPIPGGFDSNSYVFNAMVTRRPELASNGANPPEYVNLPAMNSNDFDDPGYYGGQQITNPAYTQPTTEATYGVPSDDRPAFPGYYGPTPTYPAFQVPGEKLDSPIEDESFTSSNDFVNFPPVRNPNLNMSATSSAVTSDLDLSTPAFVEDVILKDKMNTLVHKIVESLQGNFDALADMIDDSNLTAPISTYQAGTVSPGGGGGGAVTVTKKPTRKPTRVTATTRPKATTKKPITRVTTKKPATATTRKPVSRRTTTTRKPATRKPTKRVTTTTKAPVVDDEIVDEEDEEDVNPSENEIELSETINNSGGGGGGGAGADNNASGRKIQCGVRPHVKSGRIVGGKGSTFGEFPWQVLVRESTWLGLFTKNKCGGVLITTRYVITAAHCQPGFLASLVAVMGEYDISGDLESKRSVTKNVKRVIVHRQYDPATFENDLALLEMESPVQFDTHIVPICMPGDTADFTGRMATVTGWGRLKYGGGVPSVLQEVQVPVIENSVCQEMFHTAGHNKKILNSFLCAGYANGQKDSCEGDSGGPLVLQRPDGRYELAGTVSHGIKCAAPYLPGVYMRTTYYKPWLRSITGVK